MYFVNTQFKTYEWSKKGTLLSMGGAFLKALCFICICSIITMLLGIKDAINPDYKSILKVAIPVLIIFGFVFLALGILMQKKAEKIAFIDFENRVKNDFEFARKMASKENAKKEWFMDMNAEYAEYVLSGREEIDPYVEKVESKTVQIVKSAMIAIIVLILVFGGTYIFELF